MSNVKPPDWSLKKEIHKRQTQQLLRTAEIKRATPVDSKVKPVTSAQVSSIAPTEAQMVENTGNRVIIRQRWRMIMLGFSALSLLGVLLLAISLLAVPEQPAATATWPALPPSHVSTAISYLKQAGFLVLSLQNYPMPDTSFRANEAVQIELQHGTQQGLFFLLSYDASNEVGADMIRLNSLNIFKQWQAGEFANLLLLSAPNNSVAITSEVANTLNQQVVIPYRAFLLTPTVH